MENQLFNHDFSNWINELKKKVHHVRQKIAFSINSQLLELYWDLGREIDEKLNHANWGTNIIDKIAQELISEFPEIRGFSRRNLYAIRQWYKFYNQKYPFVPQAVAQIPWGHNRLIITKIKNIEMAEFYIEQCWQNGWDRETLENQISSNLFERLGNKSNNFKNTLAKTQQQLAVQIVKDPYNFDFLGLQEDALEKVIEDELTKHIAKFLLELGKGFAFVGKQFKIEISEKDYFIDMLFYHLELRAYIVIELKSGKFKPEYAGKLNFYLSAIDSQIKKETDNESIGILLCKSKDSIEAEYALRDINKPIGISEYKLTDCIPENLKYKLPTIEELENELKKLE